MIVSELDKRLLFALDLNSRQSLTSLAKKFETSPQRIQYRIERLVSEGIITSFMTTLSTKSVGYPLIAKLYIQFSGIEKYQEDEIQNFLKKDSRVNWVAKTLGDFDLFTAVMVKDFEEFTKFKKELFERYGLLISNYETSFIEKAYTLSRGYLVNKNPEELKPSKIHQEIILPLEKKDLEVLKLISDNSRISVVDLAKKLNLDVKTVVSKLKKLNNTGVIQSYRININREKLGLKYYKVFIKLKQFDALSLKKLKSNLLCRQHVIHFIENVGNYEFELEIEISNSNEMQELIRDIRNNNSSIIEKILSTEIIEELKLTWLPK